MIERQFSTTVAAAQDGSKIDAVYRRIRRALLESELPGPLKNLGLQYHTVDDLLCADLHGFRVRMRFDHVWLKDGFPIARLGGRLRFIHVTTEGKDGDELFQVLFDNLGNARVGTEQGYFSSASSDPQELISFVRKTSLALANAVHAKMSIVE
ncbi:hypothetical protein R16034_04038 [Ralstonia edaphis]|uniref:Uncharacterized protein n=1 Tax=Ralstonia edaphi TaxID=3058599 RepID=A0AB72X6L8_9RALS|nr:hypothetical protein [Ralstonia sp. LMG 6871]CAJ0744023.1 hypothetical protein R16034_04038 [Ralstonia sp. LMG 6871]